MKLAKKWVMIIRENKTDKYKIVDIDKDRENQKFDMLGLI